MMNGTLSRCLFLAAVGLWPAAAFAQAPANPTSLGTSGDWEAFTYEAEGSKVCYAFSQPKKSEANKKGVGRGPIYFMITHWPGKKVKAQPSTFIGYTFKEGSDVKLKIDAKEFVLYPVDNMAWTDKVETEKTILAAMKSGKSMVIEGTSAKGTVTKDSYSLAGISAALDTINSACK
jgi:Invasion associated locus B (IalB) protein